MPGFGSTKINTGIVARVAPATSRTEHAAHIHITEHDDHTSAGSPPAPRSPKRSHSFFLEYRRGATGEVDRAQEGLGLGIVGHGDASAPPRRTLPAVVSIGAVVSALSAGRSSPPGTSPSATATFSSGSSVASHSPHRQRTSLRIEQVERLIVPARACPRARTSSRTSSRTSYRYAHLE